MEGEGGGREREKEKGEGREDEVKKARHPAETFPIEVMILISSMNCKGLTFLPPEHPELPKAAQRP